MSWHRPAIYVLVHPICNQPVVQLVDISDMDAMLPADSTIGFVALLGALLF